MEAKEAIKRISEMVWDWKQTGHQSDRDIQAVELALNFLKEQLWAISQPCRNTSLPSCSAASRRWWAATASSRAKT